MVYGGVSTDARDGEQAGDVAHGSVPRHGDIARELVAAARGVRHVPAHMRMRRAEPPFVILMWGVRVCARRALARMP